MCSRSSDGRKAQIIIAAGLIGAIVVHAVFNFLLTGFAGFAILILIIIPVLWWLVKRKIRHALEKSPFK
jgi:RsiW-degrading membrane proteinase PrsW (M82 family)